MAAGFTYIDQVAEGLPHSITGLVNAGILAAALCALGLLATAKIRTAGQSTESAIPDAGLSLKNVFELLAGFVLSLGDSTMGRENRKYLPFIGCLFTYIFLLNITGLIPGFMLSTEQFTLNLGIGLVVFSMYNLWGIREVGVINYLKHFAGPVILLAPMMVPIELVSHSIRPLTLGLRLFGNMKGDHILLSVFNELTAGPIISFLTIPFYLLGTLVSFIQAFIFSLLTMVYIKMATEKRITRAHELVSKRRVRSQ